MTTTHAPYVANVFAAARANDYFRQVLATAGHTQLVIMMIPPGGEIGAEVHHGIDQVLIVLDGTGMSLLSGRERPISPGIAVVVPAGTEHNFRNTGTEPLRIITVYGPPDHQPGTVHRTKAEADADEGDRPPRQF
jgi:mannose-6-phosphate isomerase-like protein (cupin superfamily)